MENSNIVCELCGAPLVQINDDTYYCKSCLTTTLLEDYSIPRPEICQACGGPYSHGCYTYCSSLLLAACEKEGGKMTMCPDCGKVYDESEYTHCPRCSKKRRIKKTDLLKETKKKN